MAACVSMQCGIQHMEPSGFMYGMDGSGFMFKEVVGTTGTPGQTTEDLVVIDFGYFSLNFNFWFIVVYL